jgi:pyridoxal phosphate enzyme (YggS family)
MNGIEQNLIEILRQTGSRVTLVAVSKNHPVDAIREAYQAGQRIFGENKVQEILNKRPLLPDDIQWHLIGHLQTNKVKQIAPFISMIQSVDSLKLLKEISEQAIKNNRIINCLLQVFIATEETKFGFSQPELSDLLKYLNQNPMIGVKIRGLMGMASFTDNQDQIRQEFHGLKSLFDELKEQFFVDQPGFNELSIGMSGDYEIAIEEGSTIIRVGTKIFGTR